MCLQKYSLIKSTVSYYFDSCQSTAINKTLYEAQIKLLSVQLSYKIHKYNTRRVQMSHKYLQHQHLCNNTFIYEIYRYSFVSFWCWKKYRVTYLNTKWITVKRRKKQRWAKCFTQKGKRETLTTPHDCCWTYSAPGYSLWPSIPDTGKCCQLAWASVQPTDTVCWHAHDHIPGYGASATHFRSYV